jgi:hypothetical protein
VSHHTVDPSLPSQTTNGYPWVSIDSSLPTVDHPISATSSPIGNSKTTALPSHPTWIRDTEGQFVVVVVVVVVFMRRLLLSYSATHRTTIPFCYGTTKDKMHLGESISEPLQVLPRLFTSRPDRRLSDESDSQTNTVLFETFGKRRV